MAGVRSAGGQGRGWGGVRVPASRRAAPDRALNLYKDRTGELSHDQFADALLVSEVLAREILGRQPAILSGGVPEGLVDEADDRWVVHQASGMIAAQLDVEVGEALVRLRALAYANERSVGSVSSDVVDRRIRFDEL